MARKTWMAPNLFLYYVIPNVIICYKKIFQKSRNLIKIPLTPKALRAGYGIYIPDLDIKQSHILIGDKTNNRGELSAIIESIKLFKDDRDKGIHIYTDSQYSIQIFTTTGEKYRLKNYKKSANIEYPNSDLIRELLRLKENYIIKFNHKFSN